MAGALLPRARNEWHLSERYTVGAVIGSGAYGSIAEAFDNEEKRNCSVKQVKRLFRDLVDCKPILREIGILQSLEHQSALQIYDIVPRCIENSTDFQEIYIVMEICDSDLKKMCRQDVTLKPEHTDTLLYNLLVGLKFLHSAGVVHCDLKPACCLVNQDCAIKITDHGSSWLLTEGKEIRPRGRWYRAPEACLRSVRLTEAIDIWSAGCIYAELLGMLEGMPVEDRGPLFPGRGCTGNVESEQLRSIFQVLGTPAEADIEALEHDDDRDLVRKLKLEIGMPGTGLKAKLCHAVPNASVDVLQQMLTLDPSLRPSAESLLEHSIFSAVRSREQEVCADGLVSLDFAMAMGSDSDEEARLRQNFREVIEGQRSSGTLRKVRGICHIVMLTAVRTGGGSVAIACRNVAGEDLATFDFDETKTVAEIFPVLIKHHKDTIGVHVQLSLPNGERLSGSDERTLCELCDICDPNLS